MKIISLECPKCGATLHKNDEKQQIECDYCKYSFLFIPEKSAEEKAAEIEKIKYSETKGALSAQFEIEKKRKIRNAISLVIVGVAIAAFFLIMHFVNLKKIPELDPFEYIALEFTGINGRGEAELKIIPNEIFQVPLFQISLSEKYELFEGDQITLKIEDNSNYRYTRNIKTYTVEGLELYLADINDASEEALDIAHKHTAQEVYNSFHYIASGYESYEAKLVETYLLSNGVNKNVLFDVYQVDFTFADNSQATFYVLTFIKDLIVRDGKQVSIHFNYAGYVSTNLLDIVSATNKRGGLIYGYNTLDDAKAGAMAFPNEKMTLTELK